MGSIPSEIGNNCGKLEHLDLSGNFLGGRIPSSIGDCPGLRSLLVYSNMLEEGIPAELGRLKSLEVLDLSRNTLSGPVPLELGKCTNLSILVLSNMLNPTQPWNTTGDVILSKFYTMNDDYNYYQGELPAKIMSLPKLRILWAPRANLKGKLPEMWGNCESLEVVNLAQNLLIGQVPPQFNQCKNLRFFDLSSNRLYGEISWGKDIPCMTLFNISGNALSGQLPQINGSNCLSSHRMDGTDDSPAVSLSSYVYSALGNSLSTPLAWDDAIVVYHDFSQNNFTGSLNSLPMVSERMGGRTMYVFSAGDNDLSGPIPPNLLMNCGGAWDSVLVNVSHNRLSGPIPSGLGSSCKSLIAFDASHNQLSGTIPSSLGELTFIVTLDLSWNSLQGPIPSALGNMQTMIFLSLAGNGMNGSIPSSLGMLQYLEVLDLSSNSLSGEIPDDIVMLRCLKVLLLENNSLSGHLPSDLKNTKTLVAFNASLNNLSGPLPTNDSLLNCDDILGNNFSQPCGSFYLSASSTNLQSADSQNYAASPVGSQNPGSNFSSIEIASIASAAAIVSVLLALIVLCVYTRRTRRNLNMGPVRKELTVFNDIGVPLEFEDVVRATGGFNASNCIGSGGFGATYKAEVAPGILVAVKRLAIGRFQGIQQFHAEIKTLGQLKHENLVTLIGYHASETETFLIYNYLPGGNLERFIQERSNRPVDWRVLHKIALHVASALAYLHSKCVPRVLHRDVKPSNILLDNDYNAYLSDFGLARLLGTSETHATTGVAGTFGYVAPEYAMTCRVSDKADVYSYGVVLLELLSDKKALDPSFSSYGNGFNIVQWACMLLRQGRAKEFFMAGLWNVGPHDDLIDVLHLAVVCTVDSLSMRPTMKQVLHRLKQLQPPAR
ncbi:hypothetical protein MLD38_001288 [Melastoma candidum]|nr:hypothetical protein MLD38_001288 [Melastoma candidum]